MIKKLAFVFCLLLTYASGASAALMAPSVETAKDEELIATFPLGSDIVTGGVVDSMGTLEPLIIDFEIELVISQPVNPPRTICSCMVVVSAPLIIDPNLGDANVVSIPSSYWLTIFAAAIGSIFRRRALAS